MSIGEFELERVLELKNEIEKAQKICVFTGAGISCPSGIPDFRSVDGLYNEKGNYEYSPEEMISSTDLIPIIKKNTSDTVFEEFATWLSKNQERFGVY